MMVEQIVDRRGCKNTGESSVDALVTDELRTENGDVMFASKFI